jgi:hypothetical protein
MTALGAMSWSRRTTRRSSGTGLASDPEAAAAHPAVAHQPRGDVNRGVATDRETDALRHPDHRRVDADDAAQPVDQRPSRVARIERRVGLDHPIDKATRARAQAAPERADDPRCNSRLKAERVADRNDKLADAQPRRAAELGMRQSIRGELEHGEISGRIAADDSGADLPSIRQRCRYTRRVGWRGRLPSFSPL